jgi:hypothetical protein
LACTSLSLLAGIQGIIVGVVTRQWAGRVTNNSLVPDRDKRFCSSESWLALDHTQLPISLDVEWPRLEVALPIVVFCGSARDAQYMHNIV